MLKWDHWHIEPASVCALKCPRCPRAEVPSAQLNRQLTLQFFQQQIGPAVIKQIRKITFCGNDGDPIYCRDLTLICAWLKQQNPNIQLVIITNGSYRSSTWWTALAKVLNHNDEVHWSLDGWDQASNQQYRVNCDWRSIVTGYQTFCQHNTTSYRVWAAIAFKFNQHSIDRMQQQAAQWQFDLFQLTKSTKFGSHYPDAYGVDDPLCPDDQSLVSSSHRFERTLTVLSDKVRPEHQLTPLFMSRANDLRTQGQYAGICLIGNKGVFLNSMGEFYPCCWTANRYSHNSEWHQMAASRFNLNERTFTDIIADKFWQTDFLKFNSLECEAKCTMDKLSNLEHTTQW